MDFTESISFSIPKENQVEGMSVAAASIDDAAVQVQDSITTERLGRNDTVMETYKVVSDPVSGGMGSVWCVHHEGWDVQLAMKRPHPRFFAEAGPERKMAFIIECENWINLGLHPHIVSCYYVREVGGVPTVFSEWMDGGSLKDRIKDGSLYEGDEAAVQERILDIAIQAARGLAYSHERGLVHQDVKPGNLLLSRGWDAKVADFGLAKAVYRAAADAPDLPERPTGYTLAYCPAAQSTGEALAPWMDVYAWALTVLEMYAGTRPWESGAEVAENVPRYFPECRVPIPMDMQVLLVRCIVEHPDGFDDVLVQLDAIYRSLTDGIYPRPSAQTAIDTADFLNNRALSFLDLGKPEQARELWGLALAHNPNSSLAKHNRGVAELYELGSRADDPYTVSAQLENLFIKVVESGERSKSGADLMLTARMALSMYSPYAEQAAQQALEAFPDEAPERRICEELIDVVCGSWLKLPINPLHCGAIAFDRQGTRCYFAWVEYPKNGGDWSWTNLASCDLASASTWKQRKVDEFERDDAPYFGKVQRVILRDGFIMLVNSLGNCARFDPESLELVDILDDIPFDDSKRDDWPYIRLSDGLRSIEQTVIRDPLDKGGRGSGTPRYDIETLWGNRPKKRRSGASVSSGRGSVQDNGLDARFPAMALTMGLYAVCTDYDGRFLLIYHDHPFSSAAPEFQILDTDLFGKAPEFAVARVQSYRETVDAEAARKKALRAARIALQAYDYSEALRNLDEAYRLSPDEPGEEWVELNNAAGDYCTRDSLRGVRLGETFCTARLPELFSHDGANAVIGSDDPLLATRVFGGREPCDTRGEEKWAASHRIADDGDSDRAVSVADGDVVYVPGEDFGGEVGVLYDPGWKTLYTCRAGEFCIWDASAQVPTKLASVRFGCDRCADDPSPVDLPLFDPAAKGVLWALEPYRAFLNKEREATVAFVRSKLLNPCGGGVAGLECMTVIDLRTMTVIHEEACHPDQMTLIGGENVARVLTLVGLDANGSMAAFSHDDRWSGDGLLELWDVKEPGSFTKHFVATLASGEVGLRGDGNAIVYWSGSHKDGDAWLDDFAEHLLDWKYRLPDIPNGETLEPPFVKSMRDERKKQKDMKRREEERRRREEEARRQEEERRRQEDEARQREEERRLEQEREEKLEQERLQRELDEVSEQVMSARSQIAEKKRELESLGFFKGKEKRRLMAEIAQIEESSASAEARRVELMLQLGEL